MKIITLFHIIIKLGANKIRTYITLRCFIFNTKNSLKLNTQFLPVRWVMVHFFWPPLNIIIQLDKLNYFKLHTFHNKSKIYFGCGYYRSKDSCCRAVFIYS